MDIYVLLIAKNTKFCYILIYQSELQLNIERKR